MRSESVVVLGSEDDDDDGTSEDAVGEDEDDSLVAISGSDRRRIDPRMISASQREGRT